MLQRVISFEGIDGSGKSTYHRRLARLLEDRGYDVFVPRYEEWEKDTKINAQELEDEQAFFYHLAGTILEEKKYVQDEFRKHDFVVLDRGLDTNVVYSHLFSKLNRDRRFYDEVNAIFIRGSQVPDLTFWVETPVEIALQRIYKTRESAEFYETESYLTRLHDLFRRAVSGELAPYDLFRTPYVPYYTMMPVIKHESRWAVISGTCSYEEADRQMISIISERLEVAL